MKLRVLLFQRVKQISEVAERQFRIQTAGNVQLSRAFGDSLSGNAQRVVNVVRVSIRLARRAKEAAELAVHITNVCRIEMTIDVEVCRPSMHSPTHGVRQLAKRVEIVRIEERNAVIERKLLSGLYLGANVIQFSIV